MNPPDSSESGGGFRLHTTGERPQALRVWLLGGFRVSVGSRIVKESAWRLRKAAALVKVLALAPEHRFHREQVMELLWPGSGTRIASNSLRQVLYAARRTLDPAKGASYLASEDDSLVLCPQGQLRVDVEAFEHSAATARHARNPSAYETALDLYAGDLLPEDRYEEWVEDRRENLRQMYFALLIELARLYEERGEYRPAIEALRDATAKEPTLEEAHVGLMRLHALLGRPEQALAQYERLRDALSRSLGTNPSTSTRHLRDEIATGRLLPLPPAAPPQEEELPGVDKHNLPAPRTSFVGRKREIVEVKRTLAMTRLLTLTGTGGSGKTRLGLEVARDLIGTFPDGVWLVELAPLSEEALVPQAVAKALGVPEQPGRSLTEALVEVLREKRLLLILDNCEHLLDSVARLADTLLDSCEHLQVLATSREPLGLAGEAIWRVPSLSAPDTDRLPTAGELTRYDAVRLFLDRARLRLPDFDLTPENGRAVAEVCLKLDGIPLAIELATARMGTLAVEQVAQRLDASLDVFKGSSRTTTPRHQTLRATLDWSHNLLSEAERALFRRLSVFAGGWTLEAAEAVCTGSGIEEESVLDLLGALVDKSLVVAGASANATIRYRMLAPIRQYALGKLEESAEALTVRQRHTAYFLALAEEAEPGLTGAQQQAWVDRLEAEHDNLRAALSWSLENEPQTALRLAVALARFWEMHSYYSEGSAWLEAALRRNEHVDSALRAKALSEAGTFAWRQGGYDQAITFHGEALALYRKLRDEQGVAFALTCLGVQEFEKGELDRAAPLFEEALSLSRIIGDKRTSAFTLGNLGQVERHRGNQSRAVALNKEALSLFRDLGDKSLVIEILSVMGRDTAYHGAHEAAVEFIEEGLPLAQELKNGYCVATCLEGLAAVAGAKANGMHAARLWGAAEALREAVGAPLAPVDVPVHERNVAAARAQLDGAAWESAWKQGRAMELGEAVEYALSEEGSTTPLEASFALEQEASADEQPPNLTRREKEVAALVARGLTNRQIASELVLSERTVENYVAKILRKLELGSRVQIAARTWTIIGTREAGAGRDQA